MAEETGHCGRFKSSKITAMRLWQKNMSFENEKYSLDKDPYEWFLRQSEGLKASDPQMNIQMRNHKLLTQMRGELEHAVKCRCNHNCTLD
ncbi:hypothetical protein O181_029756 [Austropuccinia psidii MF-1]|uniref:Uncharacterized protein n=1 Tax=Austropuccinia psidii MF-1 TaxID=1389203 RepID=A0A9Q3CX46_9BASI|nr:hypothetical protein [Austropuccinia psidii MF-1]